MFFDEIIHATQYYRAPTPLPKEWEADFSRMGEYHLDTIQIRINWRWNEKRKGEYDFSDVDRLMELAEKHNKKVIIKFLLECAPQYVFDEYDGFRIGPKGEKLRGGATGAFYGGWRPCFTNPKVQNAAIKFVETVARRYNGRKNLLFWNAWNEIRNTPIEECFCPHCRAAFGKYLQQKFDTIENLNDFYGVAEESFDTIALPSMPHGYWDIFEFKKFKGSKELYNWLRFVYDAIRKYDKKRPIMAHVGCTSAFQDHLCDICDDYTVSKAVDFFGTSIPIDCSMNTPDKRMEYLMLHDFLRSIDENYFLYEIYPGLGMFRPEWYDTPYDMRFKLYAGLACGAKGFNYWQYRSERLGHEADCAGLVRMDGSPRPVIEEVKKFGENLKKNMQLFTKAKAKPADVAIVFDFDSMLLSTIESHCGKTFSFDIADKTAYYKKAHYGMYQLLRRSNYNVDYVVSENPETFKKYKVLYFPYTTMLKPKLIPYLQQFVENGGVLIADEGFGLRQANTWIQPYDIECKPLMTARLKERRMTGENITYKGESTKIAPFKSYYDVKDAETLMTFDDGVPAVQKTSYGKGSIYLFGFSVGYSYSLTKAKVWERLVGEILNEVGVKKLVYADGDMVYEKHLINGEDEIVFLFNNSNEEKRFVMQGTVVAHGADSTMDGNVLILPPMSMTHVVIR